MHAAHPPQPNSNPWRPIKARVNYNITCITQIRTSRIDYAVYFIYFILFYLFNYYASSKGLEENYSSSAHCVHNSTSRRYWTSYTCFINIRLLVYLYFCRNGFIMSEKCLYITKHIFPCHMREQTEHICSVIV